MRAASPVSEFDLGMDIGSVSVNLIVMTAKGEVLKEGYRRYLGQLQGTVLQLLSSLEPQFPLCNCRLAAWTGLGGKALVEILGGALVNEVIAQARGTYQFHLQVRTIVDMGGEDAKLILVGEEDGNLVQDFAMNTMCAAGTGSFLDQQTNRLGYTIEEFSKLALKTTTPPRVAGRCSVFAKTDMIHLQQGATPDYEIIAGLCQAMARNLKSNIAKGKTFTPPVAFQGGVAHNLGVRQAFRLVFGLGDEDLIIPPHFCSLGAINAVLVARENPLAHFRLELAPLWENLHKGGDQSKYLQPLPSPCGY
jgi:predicted CoA-substrate-specific enzyme activase